MKEESINLNQFRCRVLSSSGEGPAVIFLHGFMFTSLVWREIGLLQLLEKEKIPFTAIDMPYGQQSECEPKSSDPKDNIDIVKQVAGKKDIIVGASLGGKIALNYSLAHSAGGLFLVAPAGVANDKSLSKLKALTIPAMIIYGEEDAIVPIHEMNALSETLSAPLRMYKNAGHAAYLDQPEKFLADVVSFYRSITKS